MALPDISSIITWSGLVLTSGVFASLISIIFNYLIENRREKAKLLREARYVAVRLATRLERFALDCADQIGDYDLHLSSEGHAGSRPGTFPSIPEKAYP